MAEPISSAPADDNNDARAESSTKPAAGLRFTYGLPSARTTWTLNKPNSSLPDRHFRALRADQTAHTRNVETSALPLQWWNVPPCSIGATGGPRRVLVRSHRTTELLSGLRVSLDVADRRVVAGARGR
jgi:hypothetical protein